MRERATLEHLCERYGIAAGYEDAWGASRTDAGRDQACAVCAAMGIDVAAAANDASGAESDAGASGASAPAIVVDERAGRVAAATRAVERSRPRRSTGGSIWKPAKVSKALPRRASVAGGDGRSALEIPLPQAIGYHTLTIRDQATRALLASSRLIVTPSRCYSPPLLAGGARIWGLALQLYALRSHRNWGIGDFTDLRNAVASRPRAGADFVGINPLHALFPARPEAASPYSPSNRAALNVLYIDVEAVDDFVDCKAARARVYSPAFQSALARLRASDHVDYAGGRRESKFEILALLYDHFREHQLGASPGERGRAFRDFQRERGPALKLHGAVRRAAGARRRDHRRSRRLAELAGRVSPAVGHGRRRALSPRTPIASSISSTCSGRRSCNSARRANAPAHCGLAIGLYGDLAVSASDAAARRPGARPAVYAPDMQRRRAAGRLQSAADRTGACRRCCRSVCRRQATRPSSRRCARTCATPARCASIT